MMVPIMRKVSFSTKYLKIKYVHLFIHVVIYLSDCPEWKEEHGCTGSLMSNLCKKTCGLCGIVDSVMYFHIRVIAFIVFQRGAWSKLKLRIFFLQENPIMIMIVRLNAVNLNLEYMMMILMHHVNPIIHPLNLNHHMKNVGVSGIRIRRNVIVLQFARVASFNLPAS